MKKVLVAVLLMGLAAVSYAGVSVSWGSTYGFFLGDTDPGVGILGDGTGNSALAQLIYCGANGSVDGVNADGSSAGDDVVWDSYTIFENGIADDGDTLDSYAHFNGVVLVYDNATFVTGNVYARIFQDDVIGGGDWYFYTPTIALVDIIAPTQPQNIEIAETAMQSLTSGTGTAQVIPEPATMLLFGIGGMGAWLLRRRQQA